MSVLPESASFASFFIVFAILFLSTILLGVNLKTLLANILPLLRKPNLQLGPLVVKLSAWTESSYIQWYLNILNPYSELKFDRPSITEVKWSIDRKVLYIFYQFIRYIIRRLPVILLHSFLLREISMPKEQYILFLYRNNRYLHIKYHPIWFIKDVIRGLLIPAWICLTAGIVCYLMLQDILWVSFNLVRRKLHKDR